MHESLPERTRPAYRLSRWATSPLYAAWVPGYLAFLTQHRGLRSVRKVDGVLRQFFAWLDARKVADIGKLLPAHTRDYLASREHLKRSTVADHASVLRGMLRYLGMKEAVHTGLALAVDSPPRYRLSTPPPVLAEDSAKRLLDAVDRSTATGKRDYAILLLAARYGMRPCDIRGLRLDEVDWRYHRIVLVQSKTQRPLELPLVEDVDVALVDYLRHGRPACAAREVFVRHQRPHGPLGKNNNLWDTMHRALRMAAIAPPSGRRGLYLLRHSAATRMLAHGAPFDTISDVLGHASVESTRVYAQVDLAGLRSVALSVAEICS